MTRRARGRGFTLIELMIALTISALMVGMILSIFTRMSTAYRTQQYVADLQRRLTAAHEVVQRDIRQAGFAMPDGVMLPAGVLGTVIHPAVEIRDGGTQPDELHVFYADPSVQARVLTTLGPTVTQFQVDSVDRFQPGDLVLLSSYGTRDLASGLTVTDYHACVVQIGAIAAPLVILSTVAPWGSLTNAQCIDVGAGGQPVMAYRFVAHGYRIDPNRRDLGVLQLSPSGGLLDDWQDLGIGFTDLQVASRWYEGEDDVVGGPKTVDTDDLDTDPERDWYSGGNQTTLTATQNAWDFARPMPTELRTTLVVRTYQKLDAVGAARTPALIDTARPDNNDLGNHASVTLAGVADASRPLELRGEAIYRYATVGSDLRNLAVGR